jgi:hypothetical protein
LDDFVPEANTGLTDPNIFTQPSAPAIANVALFNSAVNSFTVSSNVPATGTTLYMDFNVGTSSNVQTHKSYTSVQVGNGTPYTANSTVTINVADLSPNTYYWSTTARNDVAGRQSNSSSSFAWAGLAVSTYNSGSNTGGITFTNIGLGTGASRVMSSYSYSVAGSGGPVTLPVDITSFGTSIKTANFEIPKYITGTTVSSTEYYPYYQGTSSTADGFLANSTSQYNPSSAGFLNTYNGDNDWWVVDYDTFNGITVPSAQSYLISYFMQVVANANTTIQLSTFSTASSAGDIMGWRNDRWTTYDLIENVPRTISFHNLASGSLVVDGGGIVMRNMLTGTQVDVVTGSLTLYQVK